MEELGLAAARIDLQHLGVELRAHGELLAEIGAARRAGVAGRDEPARRAPGGAEDAHHQAALGDLRDGDLHRLVRRHALTRLRLFAGRRRGVQADLARRGIAAGDQHLDLVADLDHLLGVLDGLDGGIAGVDEPVDPDSSSMKAPNGCSRATLPLWREPTGYLSFTASHGSATTALRDSQSLPLSSILRTLTSISAPCLKMSARRAPRSWLASVMCTRPSTPPASGSAMKAPTARPCAPRPCGRCPARAWRAPRRATSSSPPRSIFLRETTMSRPFFAYCVTMKSRRCPTR